MWFCTTLLSAHADIDKPLKEAAAEKNVTIVLINITVLLTLFRSCRLLQHLWPPSLCQCELVLILFLQAHQANRAFFCASGVEHARFRRAAFLSNVSNILTKATAPAYQP
jgi:hypothetical protein